eukprot:5608726-Amphidinium_carterae.3
MTNQLLQGPRRLQQHVGLVVCQPSSVTVRLISYMQFRKLENNLEQTTNMFSCSCHAFSSQYTWHVTLDEGPRTMPSMSLLLYIGVDMTAEGDVCHRLSNDWSSAVSHEGLGPLRIEYRQICQVRSGPFRSQSNASLLQEAVRILEETPSAELSVWQTFYEDVCRERNGLHSPSFGEPEHEESIYKAVLADLKKEGVTGAKFSRWFSFEQKMERLMKSGLSTMLFLLIFVGVWKLLVEEGPAPVTDGGPGDDARADGEAVEDEIVANKSIKVRREQVDACSY